MGRKKTIEKNKDEPIKNSSTFEIESFIDEQGSGQSVFQDDETNGASGIECFEDVDGCEKLDANSDSLNEKAALEADDISQSALGLEYNTHEEIGETIKQIKSDNEKKRKKKVTPLKILSIVFFPLTLIYLLLKKVKKMIRVPLVTKMVIYFTIAFALILFGFVVFFNMSIQTSVDNGADLEVFAPQLKMTAIALAIIAIIVFSGVVAVTSSLLLNPIRKITKGIDKITSENLSERLEVSDTQDELMELTKRINNMLQNIETTFERQENFVADASHELKTPISVISGYSNLLRRWGTSDENMVKEAVEAVNRECIYMTKLVEQLLLLAKIGKINLQTTSFDIDETLSKMVESYRLVRPNHKLIYKGQKGIILKADKNMMVELVRAIVDNAYKYTCDGGTIKLTVGMVGVRLQIVVSDNGCGIAQKDLSHIFDRFYRCDKVRERQTGSSGLGLTIAKSIVDSLNGKINVKSKVGKGTTFTIIIE